MAKIRKKRKSRKHFETNPRVCFRPMRVQKTQNQGPSENQFSRKLTIKVKLWAKNEVKKVRQKISPYSGPTRSSKYFFSNSESTIKLPLKKFVDLDLYRNCDIFKCDPLYVTFL